MTEDDFEIFLRRAARDYNAPPPTPRDAIWARVEAERRTGSASRASHGAHVRRWLVLGAAIAAMLLVGIGIGYVWRGTMDSSLVAEHRQPTPDSAERRLAGSGGESGSAAMRDSGSRGGDDTAGAGVDRGGRKPLVSTPDTRFAVVPSVPGGARPGTPESPARSTLQPAPGSARAAAAGGRESAAYAALTAEHLGRVEMLLTSYRAESERGQVDQQVASWAGDLLGTTRLLLDSPGASDPRMRKLLGDLEIVLTQITQLGAEHGSREDELQLIDQSLRSHDVMTRIRGAAPAGAGALPIGT